jgi:hypothetical protein
MFNNFFPKIVGFLDDMENRGRARQATDDSKIKHRKDVIFMPVTKARV